MSRVGRLRGSFSSIAHDVNQPLNAAIQNHLGNLFSSSPIAILQPRTAIAWQFEPKTVLRAGFGIFSDILPGSVADLIGTNPPYVQTFQGGLFGSVGKAGSAGCDPVVGCTAIAPGVPTALLTQPLRQIRFSFGISPGPLSCASPQANPAACLPPVAMTAVPDRKLHAPYFMEWSLGIEHQFGTTASLQAQYVGTRAVNQPYLTQVNGYQTVETVSGTLCLGMFARSRGADRSTIWRRHPVFQRRKQSLQWPSNDRLKRLGHGLQGQVNYTWSHCTDSLNCGFLPFAAGGVLSPLPGELSRRWPLRL